MKIGFTKAYRKELNSDIWKMPPLYQRVFFYIRQEAVWQPEIFPTRKGYGIALNPGQLITSFSAIAEGVSWYEYGVKKVPNKKIIKDILGWLEGNSMVTVFSNRHGTFIMLINWDTYNSVEGEKVTQNNQTKVTQKKRSVDTLKEGKETKEDKKIYKRKKSPEQTSLPSSFPVTEKMIKYAEQKNYVADLEDLTEAFLIHHKSKGSYFSCWYSAWQTWLRNQLDWHPEKNVPKGQPIIANFQPQTYAQAQDAERRERSNWLLKEMGKETEDEKINTQNHSSGTLKIVSELSEPEKQ